MCVYVCIHTLALGKRARRNLSWRIPDFVQVAQGLGIEGIMNYSKYKNDGEEEGFYPLI